MSPPGPTSAKGPGGGEPDPRGGERAHEPDDSAARNKAQHPRRTPGRAPTGWPVTLRWLRVTAAVLVAATLVLVVVLLLGGD